MSADAALRVAVVGGGIGGLFATDALRERDAEIVASKRFRWWIYDYDVLAEAERLVTTPSEQGA